VRILHVDECPISASGMRPSEFECNGRYIYMYVLNVCE